MLIEEALRSHLAGFPGLAALVGARVYPLKLPQGAAFPAVTYFKVSAVRVRGFGANQGGAPRFQVSCWARTYGEAKAVAKQATNALEDFSGTMGGAGGVPVKAVQLENEVDLDDPETGLYHVALDFTVWHEGD